VRRDSLEWPTAEQASGGYLSGNREYWDLRTLSWNDAERAYENEVKHFALLDDAGIGRADAVYDILMDELYESDDVGVASSVAALAAAGCIPSSSCNGGEFGDGHHETHPLVTFFAKAALIDLLIEAATSAGIGLEESADGQCLVAYSDDVMKMHLFAKELIKRRQAFETLAAVT
jgi:hypothetical protein